MGVENGMFRSEIGSGFEDPGGTPPPRIPRSTPPGSPLLEIFLFCQPIYDQKTVSNALIASLRMEDFSDNELTVGFSTFCKAIFYTRAKNDS